MIAISGAGHVNYLGVVNLFSSPRIIITGINLEGWFM